MRRDPPRLAVVDDDDDVRVAVCRLIASAGFAVEAFASGAEFLQSLEREEPDCVVLDLHMPGMSGFEVQEALARDRRSVQVIVLTGHNVAGSHARVLARGAAACLCKPADDRVLLAAIDAALRAGPP